MPLPYMIKQPITEEEFKQYFHLRWQLLRAPWNEPEGTEKDAIEDQCFHIMVCHNNNHCIGVGRLQFNSETEVQIRYMAVAKSHQNNGIGAQIILALEEYARNRNIKNIVLDAREPAIGFYQKLGYTLNEKTYLLFGQIQHYRMMKIL